MALISVRSGFLERWQAEAAAGCQSPDPTGAQIIDLDSQSLYFFAHDNGMMHMTSKWLDLESVSESVLTASANIFYGDQGVDR